MILCYIEIFFLHYTGPTGAAAFYSAAAARPPPRVPAGPRAPPVVPVRGRGRGGRAQARGGRRGRGRARGAAVLLRPMMYETQEIRRCHSSRPLPLVCTSDNDCCAMR